MKKTIENKSAALTVQDHTYNPTTDPDILRVCDQNGDWVFYFKKSTNQYAPAVNHVLTCGFNKGAFFQKWLLNQRPEEAQKVLESAGDRGSRVHAAIRDLLGGYEVKIDQQYPSELQNGRFEKLTAEEWNCLRGFANFVNDYKPEVYGQELTVFSQGGEYAGTIDFLGTLEIKGVRIPVLVDWKTSGGIWNEYKLQVAAYFAAWNQKNAQETGFEPVMTAIVRIGTKHRAKYEIQIFNNEETSVNVTRFCDVINLYRFANPDDKEPKIEELPTSFKFSIPIWQPLAPVQEPVKAPRKRQTKTTKTNVGKTNSRGSRKVRSERQQPELLQVQGGKK